ncbi:MAG: caspase family protein [Bacteroidota bacterium]
MQTREDIPLGTQSQNLTGRNHLVVISVDRYTNGISPLNNAVSDGRAFGRYLLTNYDFSTVHYHELLDEKASCSNVLNLFDQLIGEVQEADNLILYFSGHGVVLPSMQRGSWLLADARAGERSTYLANHEVIHFVQSLAAQHVFVVVDSCFSGQMFRRTGPIQQSKLYQKKSRYLLTSGRSDEPVLDGPPGGHSPFCKALLNAFEETAEETLWVGDLCRKVLHELHDSQRDQLPRGEPIKDWGHEGGEFAFWSKNVDRAVALSPKETLSKKTKEYQEPSNPAPTKHSQVDTKGNHNITIVDTGGNVSINTDRS